jgi:hypothetical protein
MNPSGCPVVLSQSSGTACYEPADRSRRAADPGSARPAREAGALQAKGLRPCLPGMPGAGRPLAGLSIGEPKE